MARRTSIIALAFLGIACRDEAPATVDRSTPTEHRLRHEFEVGRMLRYESKTLEHSAVEISITMRSSWRVTKVRGTGAGEVEVRIEHYEQRVFPAVELPREVKLLNSGLSGARFQLLVTPDGMVEHLGQDKVPALSEFSLEAVRSSLASHVLKMPGFAVHSGQRWTVGTPPPPDAGPGAVTTTSQWRVLSVRPERGRSLVELVCLSSMEAGGLEAKGRPLGTRTDFHYSYLWNATGGYLEGLTSRGSTDVWELEEASDGGRGPTIERTRFEADLRLLPGSRRQ